MRNMGIYLILAVIALACLLYPSTSEGQEYEFVLSLPKEVLGLREPRGVAVDGSGNVYVADTGNHRIQKFRPGSRIAVEPGEKLVISWGNVKGASDMTYSFALKQNYPNPFNPETWIPYQLAEDSDVTIRIYSTTGQLIRLLDLGYKKSGSYVTKDAAAYWDGANDLGEQVVVGR